MKILPSLYKGKTKKNKNQNETVIQKVKENVKNVVKERKNINNKIKDIFSSPNYVYKADVNMILKDGTTLKKTIIGRTNNSLITIDDELINVSNIVQIDFVK